MQGKSPINQRPRFKFNYGCLRKGTSDDETQEPVNCGIDDINVVNQGFQYG